MAKALVVTDYSGSLHITPLGNKSYYQKQNKLIKTKQFGLQEMDEEDAKKFVEDNKGRDPKFVRPADTKKIIDSKDKQIEDLKAQIAALMATNQNGSGSDQTKQTPSQETDSSITQLKAVEVIEKIKAATTSDEVNVLASGDTRATVIAAAAAKLEELKKQQ